MSVYLTKGRKWSYWPYHILIFEIFPYRRIIAVSYTYRISYSGFTHTHTHIHTHTRAVLPPQLHGHTTVLTTRKLTFSDSQISSLYDKFL
ncbi:hypothetical protein MTR_1g072920 [Medicago truncatula]|uniref:Uncharacterized protein n=1 Tax=Medicago truncatula TaxID=3880 RepID=G7I2N0_MEDTR|nr:hypothetical protein MTR_1g072920 [Medicago truncatula]